MPAVLNLAFKSLWNRRLSVLLTIITVAASVALLLSVDKVRNGARAGFENTIAGTDLVVGARSGPVNLLLYSVFRLGDPTANITWESYELLSEARGVAWAVPISLGDSHQGYRVVGTTPEYFEHVQYGRDQSLRFAGGEVFVDVFDAVIGAEVARMLNYRVGDEITLAHGVGAVSFLEHSGSPFRVAGILAPTGTPIDRSVHVSLEGIEAIHVGWENGAPPGRRETLSQDDRRTADLAPEQVTAVFIGMESPIQILRLQRQINTYEQEALSAIIPGVALSQLWSVIGVVERTLVVISVLVLAVTLISVLVSISSSINERRREMAILRAVGAGRVHVFGLLVCEAASIAFVGTLIGIFMTFVAMAASAGWLLARYGLSIGPPWPGMVDVVTLIGVPLAAALLAVVPAMGAVRHSLADGLSIRL